MKRGLQIIIVLAFVLAASFAGCDYIQDKFDGDDPEKNCSIGVNVSSLGTGCKYHITILMYGCSADFITWSFDDGYWNDVDVSGMDTFTFEQAFSGPGTYAINVRVWKNGEVIASRSDGLTIDCK